MPFDPSGSVTAWLARLNAGDREAFDPLFRRYFTPLAAAADRRLPAGGIDDGDDVANSAFMSFWRAVGRGRFPDLNDRTDLWKSLLFVLSQKVADRVRHAKRKKRGGGTTRIDFEIDDLAAADGDPLTAAAVDEEFRRLFDVLGDHDLRCIARWKLDGETHVEIAERIGCVPRTIVNKVKLIQSIWAREARS